MSLSLFILRRAEHAVGELQGERCADERLESGLLSEIVDPCRPLLQEELLDVLAEADTMISGVRPRDFLRLLAQTDRESFLRRPHPQTTYAITLYNITP